MANEPGTSVRTAATNGKMGHSLISDKKFRQLYELALKLQIAARHGGEAAIAGVAADLRADDVLVAADAGSVEEMLHGDGVARMDRRSFEERVIEALSDAVGDRMRKNGRVTVILLGGGEREEFVREARTLAIGAKLPVLLVEKKPERGRGSRAKKTALEYPSIPVDTNDVIAMYRVAHESIARAREGSGPTHIVGVRWQLAGAKTGKNAARTQARDAVEHLGEWLIARGLPAQAWRGEILAELEPQQGKRIFGAQQVVEGEDEVEEAETRAIA